MAGQAQLNNFRILRATNTSRESWKIIKEFGQRDDGYALGSMRASDDTIVCESKEIADLFADYFSEVSRGF